MGKSYCSMGRLGVHILQVPIQRLTYLLILMKIVSMVTYNTLVCCIGKFDLVELTS